MGSKLRIWRKQNTRAGTKKRQELRREVPGEELSNSVTRREVGKKKLRATGMGGKGAKKNRPFSLSTIFKKFKMKITFVNCLTPSAIPNLF